MIAPRTLVLLTLVVALAACKRSGPELGAIQRLNSEPGNLGRYLIPYYTGVAPVPDGGAVAVWMEMTGGHQPFFFSRAPNASSPFAPGEPLAPPEYRDTVSSGLSLVPGPEAGQLSVAWQARRPLTGDKMVFFRGTTDGGRSWSDAHQLNTLLTSFAAALAVDSAGGVFAAWPDERATKREVFFNRSLDHGKSWMPSEVELESGAEEASLEGVVSVASDGDQRVLVVWTSRESRRRIVHAALSEDRGATFLPAVAVDDGTARSSPMFPQAAFAGSRAVVVWIVAAAGADVFSQIWADTSADGKTWGTDVLVRDQPGGVAPSVRLASGDGRVHLVFDINTRGRDVEAVYHLTVDSAGVWAPPVDTASPISPAKTNCTSPHLARDPKGTLYVVFEEESKGLFLTRSKDGGVHWDPPALVYEREAGAPPASVKLPQVAAADGVTYVLWEEWGDVREVVKSMGDLQKKRAPVDLYVRRVTFGD